MVHEFGHSFAGLADEYAYESEQIPMYPHDVEPWEPNITTLADFHGKWENMIKKGTRGSYSIVKEREGGKDQGGRLRGCRIQS